MNGREDLSAFLSTRRSQLRPEDVGLKTYGERRRVPGLRREELALLAGVSTSYYTRLEQGQSINASPEVLDAIAQALRLDEAERAHLHGLARARTRRGRPPRPVPERVTAATSQLVAALGDAPVIVLGRRSDVLAWNRMGHALFAGHLDPDSVHCPADRPNMTKLVFLDAHIRALYADWPSKARAVVANLRLTAGQYAEDTALTALIGELARNSPEFASMWAAQRVQACDVAQYEMHHPLVGTLTVNQQALSTRQGGGQHVVLATTESDSASQSALALLAQAIEPNSAPVRDSSAHAR